MAQHGLDGLDVLHDLSLVEFGEVVMIGEMSGLLRHKEGVSESTELVVLSGIEARWL